MLEIIKNSEFDTVHNVYQIFTDINLFYAFYWKNKSKPGNMTPGADNKTIDGMNLLKLENLQKTLINESYKVKPTKRTYIPKKNGTKRPLGIPTISDKMTQYILNEILDSIYGNKFSTHSHGFMHNKGAHTCLKNVKT